MESGVNPFFFFFHKKIFEIKLYMYTHSANKAASKPD